MAKKKPDLLAQQVGFSFYSLNVLVIQKKTTQIVDRLLYWSPHSYLL